MKTGEGKTLVSTLPGYLNALGGEGVHLVTVNDYLAKRDSEWMGGIYRFLGLDVASSSIDDPRAAPARVRSRHHLRHQQRVRVRLSARQHGDAPGAHGAARAPFRDRGRGRLDPDRRGAHAADHLRHGARLREVVRDLRAPRAEAHPRGLRGRRGQAPGRRHRGRRRQGRGDAGDREPLRAREHAARAPYAELAARQGALQAGRRVRRDERRGQDRRRVHRARAGGPPLLRGPASGDRGQGGRADQGGEPDARHDHDPELLQDVRQALRHDRYGEDPAHRVRGHLQDRGRRDPHEPADGPRRRAGPDLQDRGCEMERGRRRHHRAQRGGPAGARRHRLDREVRAALAVSEPARRDPQRPEREEPREGSRHRRAGRPQGRGHGRHQHGRSRRRHPPGWQPRVPGAPGDGGPRTSTTTRTCSSRWTRTNGPPTRPSSSRSSRS